jgi:phosphoribosylglycinamide formyltransferase 1
MTPGLCVMLSGKGRTLDYLLDAMGRGDLPMRPALVIASRQCPGADLARARGIPTLVIPGRIPARVLADALARHDADLVALGGYLQLVEIPPGWEGRIVNIHPALLPRHGGPGMHGRRVHEAVLAAGDAESGCTVHLCDSTFDTGRVVLQRRCPVLPGDTPETLAARVFALEQEAYPRALADLARQPGARPCV